MSIRYYLRCRPGEKIKTFKKSPTPIIVRQKFGLLKYQLITRAEKNYLELDAEEEKIVNDVNAAYQSSKISFLEAKVRLEEFIAEKYRRQNVGNKAVKNTIISSYNSKLFSKFWQAKYEEKELEDKNSARYDFNRALRAIEPLFVDARSIELRNKLELLPITKRKRICARLNEIRRFLKIEDMLEIKKSEIKKIRYIKLIHLHKMLQHIENEDLRSATATLFATGVRLGELMALEPSDYSSGYLIINKQIRVDGTLKEPKRGKTGKVVIVAELKKYVEAFLKVKNKHILRSQLQNEVSLISHKIINNRITVHDLRHSHAIHLLSKGASLTLISLQLRNRIEVCQKYYSGFDHTDDTLVMLKAIAS